MYSFKFFIYKFYGLLTIINYKLMIKQAKNVPLTMYSNKTTDYA